jgi:small subunit ribosomal protein S18
MTARSKSRTRSKPASATSKAPARRGRRKVCLFCAEHIAWVDYKDTNLLRRFMTDRGKIKSRANTGTCAQHQRDVAVAVKTAREMAMLPYLVRTMATDKSSRGRGRGPGGPGRPDRPDSQPSEAAATPAVSAGEGDLTPNAEASEPSEVSG